MLQKLLGKLRSKWTLFTILGIILGFVSGFEVGKDLKVVYIHADSVVTLVDTLIQKEIVYEQLPAEVEVVEVVHTVWDTITETMIDTLILTEVARIDTTLEDGHLSLAYYVKPRYFDFSWQPVPLEVRCKKLIGGTIGFEPPRTVSFSLGAGLGRTWDEKSWTFSGLFAGHFFNNMLYLEADKEGYTLGYARKFY